MIRRSRSLTYLKFKQAQKIVQELEIKNSTEYRELYESKKYQLPCSPQEFYGLIPEKIPTYKEGKKIVKQLKIKTSLEYRKLHKAKKLKGLPSWPEDFVEWKKQWKGWSKFLAFRSKNFLEFEEAKILIKKYNLKTIEQFKELKKKDKNIREKIPIAPYKFYIKQWKGWGDFLGNGKIPLKERKYATHEEAQKYIEKKGIQNRKAFYEKWRKGELKEKQIPIDPERIYKRTGEWEGWTKLFGKNHNHGNYLSYEEAQKKCKEKKIVQGKQYKKLRREGKLGKEFPSAPDKFYKKQWKNWRVFLQKEYVSFNVCRKFARSSGIKSGYEWNQIYLQGLLPKQVPSDPERYYGRKF